ncbi:RidA family protein [Flavobacteriaceae bacterium]|jgi:2-iminobutanoate/2-iminopropanoate deaminase|nr:RidA family protein [Flavobacteriaceae bacterium]MDC1392683.1 RidA family protein [Flavobacteriaceae bacterium]|tara:strand:+ start:1136 stop:1519 length:384 start_codon:yes stop_codon:yes gene_type:complete
MKKEIITTLNAPAPIGPYNQAIKVGNTLYVSGQIPINAKTMEIFNGTIKEETELVMLNLNAVLEAASMSFEHVVKTNIFLSDMENFGKVNNVYGTYFDNDTAPARETVAVKTLPKNVRIEISMIAVK